LGTVSGLNKYQEQRRYVYEMCIYACNNNNFSSLYVAMCFIYVACLMCVTC